MASYIGPDDEEHTANSSTFLLEGEMLSGTNAELTIGIEDYKTLCVPHLEDMAEPWDGSTGGYLIEGASAGTNVYMMFTKDQYDNDTAVKLQASEPAAGDSYQEVAYLLGPELAGSATQPAIGWRVTNNVLRTFVMSIDNSGTANSEFVVVIGTLANAVSSMGTVKKTDFVSGYSYYNFKIVESAP